MTQLLPVLSPEQLFAQCKLDYSLSELRTLTGLDTAIFDLIIRQPILDFAELATRNIGGASSKRLRLRMFDAYVRFLQVSMPCGSDRGGVEAKLHA